MTIPTTFVTLGQMAAQRFSRLTKLLFAKSKTNYHHTLNIESASFLTMISKLAFALLPIVSQLLILRTTVARQTFTADHAMYIWSTGKPMSRRR